MIKASNHAATSWRSYASGSASPDSNSATGSYSGASGSATGSYSGTSGSRRGTLKDQLTLLTQQVADRTQLSTTGYQSAMARMNRRGVSDARSLMTMSRAEQYSSAAKQVYPVETLKSLARLQQSEIYRTSNGDLRGAIEMSPEQLTESLQKCRRHGFSNCDMQALEVGLHMRHELGVSDFSVVSNHRSSHSYVVLPPSDTFSKGAIVDSWSGQGVQELTLSNKLKFKHREGNYKVNENMHEWIEKYGAEHVRDRRRS